MDIDQHQLLHEKVISSQLNVYPTGTHFKISITNIQNVIVIAI